MTIPRNLHGVLGGLIAGAIGAAVWAGVASCTGYEIGWIAWGVGALVGLGYARAARGVGRFPGIAAAVIAFGSIMAGKYLALQLIIDEELTSGVETMRELLGSHGDQELLISLVADEIVDERYESDAPVHWPGGVEPDEPVNEEDYPLDVWREATGRWNAMSAADREDFSASWVSEVGEYYSGLGGRPFLESFGPLDIGFCLLAIATAYKIASSATAAVPESDGDGDTV